MPFLQFSKIKNYELILLEITKKLWTNFAKFFFQSRDNIPKNFKNKNKIGLLINNDLINEKKEIMSSFMEKK